MEDDYNEDIAARVIKGGRNLKSFSLFGHKIKALSSTIV